jgi:predicted hydrocarbon binding protein
MCCGAVLSAGSALAEAGQATAAAPPVSDCNRKVKQGQDVIRRIMQQLDAKVDPATRKNIMESCGRACYEGAHGARKTEKPTPEQAAKFLDGMRKYLGADGVKQTPEETVVYFKYTGNPQGLKVSDGYCLCPILEDAPKDIPPSYCQCSSGYVREIFERGVGRPARVEITETVLRGGQSCRFTVSFKS